MNEEEERWDGIQCVSFSELNVPYEKDDWMNLVRSFGYVRIFTFSSNYDHGYALFEYHKDAVRAAEALHETEWPQNSGNKVLFQLCKNEEIEMAVHIGNDRLQDVKILEPETGQGLFHITETAPPVCWSIRKF